VPILNLLVVSGSRRDQDALELGLKVAAARGCRLKLLIPVPEPTWGAYLAYIDVDAIREELRREAERHALACAKAVPAAVSLEVRCLPRSAERALLRELDAGVYDACVLPDRLLRKRLLWSRAMRTMRRLAQTAPPSAVDSVDGVRNAA
jgi:hypothetical protein